MRIGQGVCRSIRRTKFLSTISSSTAGDTWLLIKFLGTLNFATSCHGHFLARRSIGSCASKKRSGCTPNTFKRREMRGIALCTG